MMNKTGAGALPGFSEEEAASRLREEGYNELPSSKRRSIVAIALGGYPRADVPSPGLLRAELPIISAHAE
jgi:hypothetical protein